MTIDLNEIKKLANLGKLELTEAEENQYLKDVNGILDYLNEIKEAKLDDVVATHSFYNHTRSDILEKRDYDMEQIYANMPAKSSDNQVKVSKVLKK